MSENSGRQQHEAGGTGRFLIQRRQFLRFGSLAVAGIAATGLADDAVLSAAGALFPRALPLLSIGYWPGSFQDRDARSGVIDARKLASGDRSFLESGARLRVAGFWRAERHEGKPLSVAFNVHYPVMDLPEQRALFTACSYTSSRRSATIVQPLSINVPVDAIHAVEISVEGEQQRDSVVRALTRRVLRTAPTEAVQRDRSVVRLGAGASGVAAKLRRGVYFLAVRESERDVAPDWSTVRVRAPENGVWSPSGVSPLFLDTIAGPRSVPFTYAVISADYARV